MRLSRTIAYAIQATLDLARAAPGVPVPCSELARAGNLPERFLLQVLRTLVAHGLLRSTRGVIGGYCLSRPPAEISLGDVVDAFEYPHEPSANALEALEVGVRAQIHLALEAAFRAERQELQKLSLADLLCADAAARHHFACAAQPAPGQPLDA